MTVVFIPFSTALMAEHLKSGADEEVGGGRIRTGLPRDGHLDRTCSGPTSSSTVSELGVELTDEEVREHVQSAFMVGNPLYAVAVIVAFISPAVVLVIVGRGRRLLHGRGMRSPDL